MLHSPTAPFLGAAYYPEVWPPENVDTDIAQMQEAGINCVRIAEFAWSSMEPREGVFDFAWLHTVVDKLHRANIAVVLCTPTATPPKWLTDTYPETLQMYSNGTRAQFGGRCHVCKTSPVMREKNRIIVTRMCEEFAHHPAVVGWQIDNELYMYGDGCFCPHCQKAFSAWLQKEYGTIENLNTAWGTSRWSLTYSSFEDVIPPRHDTWNHPSLFQAWMRFSAENIVSYAAEQADIIRRYFEVPVGTDMMPNMELSYYDMAKHMDVMQFNHYDTAENLWRSAFWFDFLRPIKPEQPFWNTETQTAWNGGTQAASGYRPKGNCYMNTMLPLFHGGEMNLYWLWRTHPHGHELAHGAVVSSAGRFYHIVDEVQQASRDLERCADFLSSTKVQSEIALHYSATSALNLHFAPLVEGMNYQELVQTRFYKPLRRKNVDVIDTLHDLDGYKVVISPLLTTVDENGLKEKLLAWIANGGTWIAGPMTDIMRPDAVKYTHAPYSFLEELAGVYTKYQIYTANNRFRLQWADGTESPAGLCYDAYECRGAESLATYANDVLKGLSAVTCKQVGRGKVILLGTLIPEEQLLQCIGLPDIVPASENVSVTARYGPTNGLILAELEGKCGTATLPGTYTCLLTGQTLSGTVALAPYQALVLQPLDA